MSSISPEAPSGDRGEVGYNPERGDTPYFLFGVVISQMVIEDFLRIPKLVTKHYFYSNLLENIFLINFSRYLDTNFFFKSIGDLNPGHGSLLSCPSPSLQPKCACANPLPHLL